MFQSVHVFLHGAECYCTRCSSCVGTRLAPQSNPFPSAWLVLGMSQAYGDYGHDELGFDDSLTVDPVIDLTEEDDARAACNDPSDNKETTKIETKDEKDPEPTKEPTTYRLVRTDQNFNPCSPLLAPLCFDSMLNLKGGSMNM